MKMVHNEYTSIFPMDNIDTDKVSDQYAVFSKFSNTSLTLFKFQTGTVAENGINGASEIDILTILKLRLEETGASPEVLAKVDDLIEELR